MTQATANNYENSLLEQCSPEELLDKLDKLESEEALRNFIELGWDILEPGRVFIPGWHIDAICDHLEGVTCGDIDRLLINVPPGCMKSLTVNVFWPSWEWGPKNMPSTRYVSGSYSHDLTVRDNRKCRNLITSSWYRNLWGDRFSLTTDQNAKVKFENDKTGFKLATSVDGLGTGERGDRFIIDDPHNVKDGESDAKRYTTELWFTETVPTRMSDPERSAIVVIMQRVHELDVSGIALSRDLGYTHLCLPMEFEPEKKCFSYGGFEDPRKDENELLWRDRMTRRVVERDKKAMGSYATAGQFQQRPSPRGGGLFKRDDFKIVDEPPGIIIRRVRGWDLAATEKKQASCTVGLKMGITAKDDIVIEDVVRGQWSPGKVETEIEGAAKRDGHDVKIDIPQDPGQAGKAQKAALAKLLHGFSVFFSPETGSKEKRAEPLAAQTEAGNVYIMRAPWNDTFLHEASTFPNSSFKDQVDAASRAYSAILRKTETGVGAAPEVIDNG